MKFRRLWNALKVIRKIETGAKQKLYQQIQKKLSKSQSAEEIAEDGESCYKRMNTTRLDSASSFIFC